MTLPAKQIGGSHESPIFLPFWAFTKCNFKIHRKVTTFSLIAKKNGATFTSHTAHKIKKSVLLSFWLRN